MIIARCRKYLPILPSLLVALWARHRRNRGQYDRRTRFLFHLLWHRRRTPEALLDYLLFRRDLGFPVLPSKSTALINQCDKLHRKQDLALALVAEQNLASLKSISRRRIIQHANHMAPLADIHRQLGGMETLDWLADLSANQTKWRNMFSADVANTSTSICVVGNASTLCGSNLGAWIDSHDRVVRFNRHRGPNSHDKDLGTRLDLWAMAPSFVPSENAVCMPPWIVITGPDVLFLRRNWLSLRTRLDQGDPVLTVPLPVWRDLVAHLQAPPSAGLLVLAWIRVLRGSWQGIHTVGLGVLPSRGIPYHHADHKHRPTTRHNWEYEKQLLHAWGVDQHP